ncbi:MAG: hypothetical protein ACRCXZ_00225 [Patescibacteria group bacterium]
MILSREKFKDCPKLTRGWFIKAIPLREACYEALLTEIEIISIKDFNMISPTMADLYPNGSKFFTLKTPNDEYQCSVSKVYDTYLEKEVLYIRPI